MATLSEWIGGARLRTLPAAIAPVLVGTALAWPSIKWINALLALLVALFLQIGVNYANDYSDGIRGTDTERVGPMRLVGSGKALPKNVRNLAFTFFGSAAVCGLVLALRTSLWLILVGALAIAAAWGYTGGKNPYGYRALGEISVFLFFGLVAVLGSNYVQSSSRSTFSTFSTFSTLAILAAIPIGAQACAILALNNLRDRVKDIQTGKRTLAVLMGDRATRYFYAVLIFGGNLIGVATSLSKSGLAITALLLPFAGYLAVMVLKGAGGRDLITLLQRTAIFQLLFALLYAVGLVWSA